MGVGFFAQDSNENNSELKIIKKKKNNNDNNKNICDCYCYYCCYSKKFTESYIGFEEETKKKYLIYRTLNFLKIHHMKIFI